MGYQESYIKFPSTDALKDELNKYKNRDVSNDLARVVCVSKVVQSVTPFKEGELIAVVAGERSEQRNLTSLYEGLGILQADAIIYIDNEFYWMEAKKMGISIPEFLDMHFQRLSDKETDDLLA